MKSYKRANILLHDWPARNNWHANKLANIEFKSCGTVSVYLLYFVIKSTISTSSNLPKAFKAESNTEHNLDHMYTLSPHKLWSMSGSIGLTTELIRTY